MAFSSDVIFIDKQILLNTYADLGITGLDAYANRSFKVFVSFELRTELRDAIPQGSPQRGLTSGLKFQKQIVE